MVKNLFIQSNSEKETQSIAGKIAGLLSGGEVILLEGDLGGGKTTFVKGLAKALGVTENITSPSFVIKKNYPCEDNLNLEHIDLYRLSDNEIWGDPALLENLDDKSIIAIIEWGEKIQKKIKHYLSIKFNYIDQNQRKLEFSAQGKKEIEILHRISNRHSGEIPAKQD